jgi:hypothetical protein
MGANVSKINVSKESINESITNAFSKNSSSCDQTYIANQLNGSYHINADGCTINAGEVKNVWDGTTSFKCLNKQVNTQDIYNEFINSLKDNITNENKGVALGVNLYDQYGPTDIINKATSTISIDNIASCMQNKVINQTIAPLEINCSNNAQITVEGVGNYIYDKTLMDCANDQLANFVNKLKTDSDVYNVTDNKNTGLDPTTFLVVVILVPIIGIVILILIGYFSFKSITGTFSSIGSSVSSSSVPEGSSGLLFGRRKMKMKMRTKK